MDGLSLSLIIIVIPSSLIVVYHLWRVCNSIWWEPKRLERELKNQGIKGNSYKLLMGDMNEFIRQIKDAWSKPMDLNHGIAPRVDPFTHTMVRKYGQVSLSWMGPTPRLIVKDAEMMKQVLNNKQGHFQKPYLNPLILVLAKGLTTLEGDKWAKHRKIINPAFHLDKLKGMVPVMAATCDKFIERWRKFTDAGESYELDMWPEFQNLSADLISRTAFGSSYQEGKTVFERQKELVKLVIEAMQMLYIPGFRYIPTKKNRRRKQLDKMITSILTELVRTKANAIKADESKADDLLGLLLHSNHRDNAENSGDSQTGIMTLEEVIEECKLFYLAGQETTASLLTWTIIVLAMHLNWQEKAREEVLRVCGGKPIDYEATIHLKIVTMILQEVLRLYPPVIAQYQHTTKDTKIGDISVPAGVDITLPTLLIHHDLELWGEDVEEFNPERFSEGVTKVSKDRNTAPFFPFGWGPRTCIGQNFALIEAKVALAMILRNFSFELSPSYAHAPHTVMMLQPQRGAHIVLQSL